MLNMWKSIILIDILFKSIFVVGQFYETKFEISSYDYDFNLSDLLNSFIVKNVQYCSIECNQINQCSFFEFNSSTKLCRLFLFGSIKSSLFSTTQVGFVKYSIDQYSTYNQTCQFNSNQINRYLICGNNNTYQCPQGLSWNGTMCTALYWSIGPQLNLNSSILRGWSLCYNNTYDIQLHGSSLNNILKQCNKSKLLLGCGPLNNSNIYSVAAMDYRQNVLYNCSNNNNCSYISNGLQWYFSDNSSWGFADQLDILDRSPCDTYTLTNPSSRLCWHTNPGFDGYRCGSILFNWPMNTTVWQRVIWHAD